jgi:hypothetical protein
MAGLSGLRPDDFVVVKCGAQPPAAEYRHWINGISTLNAVVLGSRLIEDRYVGSYGNCGCRTIASPMPTTP